MRILAWQTGLGIVFAAGLVAALLVVSDPQAFSSAFQTMDPVFLLFGLLAYAFFFILRGVRWRILLRDTAPGASVVDAATVSAAGWLVSTFRPYKAGDATRADLLANRTRSSLFGVTATVYAERALDLLSLALFASVSALVVASSLRTAVPTALADAASILWALPIALFLTLVLIPHLASEHRRNGFLIRFLSRFGDAAQEIWRTRRRLPIVLVLSVAIAFTQAAAVLFLVYAIAPQIPLPLVAAAVPWFLLSFGLSITPMHMGTYESAFVLIFSALGVPIASLVGPAFALHFVSAALVTTLGLLGVAQFRLTEPSPAPPATMRVDGLR